jgi:hypothetical protein
MAAKDLTQKAHRRKLVSSYGAANMEAAGSQ